jgi:hypothetical protein
LLIFLLFTAENTPCQPNQLLKFDFFGSPVEIPVHHSISVPFAAEPGATDIARFISQLQTAECKGLIHYLQEFKSQNRLNDWVYYQLIRKTAQQISPKADNYYRYTLYKWFLLTRSGYDATLKSSDSKLLFYVRTDEKIYNIPCYLKNNRQYVCLNYHDYGSSIDFEKEHFTEIALPADNAIHAFSYKITRLPEFNPTAYEERDVQFSYGQDDYHFKIKLNPQVKTIFANYPVLDYASYFNIPLSTETYHSLIPLLKKHTRKMTVKNGVDYLMRFTRYAFMYKPDAEIYGTEKRLTPEQTLLYPESDCEDRAALFFYLVKEIYNLPMIVVAWPEHVSVAVRFDKSVGKPIVYNGEKYSICDPTPQKTDLAIGQQLPGMTKEAFEIVYAYNPGKDK